MLLYILFLVILIKIIINLFIKINIEKFTSKQEILNKVNNIKSEPSNTSSESYNITDFYDSYNINSNMNRELMEQRNIDISLNRGFDEYVERVNFYDEHISQIRDYVDTVHNPYSDSGYEQHIFNLARKSNNNQEILGSPQVQFNRIVDNYGKMYNKFLKYQTDDIEEKIKNYEDAKEKYL